MFGIGFSELVLILIVGLLVIGPQKLPELARSLAKGLAEFRKAASDIRDNLHTADPDEVEPGKPASEPKLPADKANPRPSGPDDQTEGRFTGPLNG